MKTIDSRFVFFLKIVAIILTFLIESTSYGQGFNDEYSFSYDAAGNRIGVIKLKTALMTPDVIDLKIDLDTINSFLNEQLIEDEFCNDEFSISVYPVPVKRSLNISIATEDECANYLFNLCDISGKNLLSGNLSNGKNTFDVFDYPDGIYILKIIYQKKVFQTKIIKE